MILFTYFNEAPWIARFRRHGGGGECSGLKMTWGVSALKTTLTIRTVSSLDKLKRDTQRRPPVTSVGQAWNPSYRSCRVHTFSKKERLQRKAMHWQAVAGPLSTH